MGRRVFYIVYHDGSALPCYLPIKSFLPFNPLEKIRNRRCTLQHQLRGNLIVTVDNRLTVTVTFSKLDNDLVGLFELFYIRNFAQFLSSLVEKLKALCFFLSLLVTFRILQCNDSKVRQFLQQSFVMLSEFIRGRTLNV